MSMIKLQTVPRKSRKISSNLNKVSLQLAISVSCSLHAQAQKIFQLPQKTL